MLLSMGQNNKILEFRLGILGKCAQVEWRHADFFPDFFGRVLRPCWGVENCASGRKRLITRCVIFSLIFVWLRCVIYHWTCLEEIYNMVQNMIRLMQAAKNLQPNKFVQNLHKLGWSRLLLKDSPTRYHCQIHSWISFKRCASLWRFKFCKNIGIQLLKVLKIKLNSVREVWYPVASKQESYM